METITSKQENYKAIYIADNDIVSLINTVRNGINFNNFLSMVVGINFNLHEWSTILHLSDRTIQRYKKENITFEPLQSEKILQVALIFQKGQDVFGDAEKFNIWLDAENQALGKVKPKELLDNTFGIKMIEDELTKIEFGILA
ncbi:MAG: antitoxin Xre/MbcA/ParS toxin-binding domain-containing protein [Paludibacter sp.]